MTLKEYINIVDKTIYDNTVVFTTEHGSYDPLQIADNNWFTDECRIIEVKYSKDLKEVLIII